MLKIPNKAVVLAAITWLSLNDRVFKLQPGNVDYTGISH